MAEVKWIKLDIGIFDNRKVRHLRRLPDGDSIVLIYIMLLTLAGRCNANGLIFLTENIPYTAKMLADELDFEEYTVQLAIQSLEQLDMVSTNGDGFLSVTGWADHQNIEGMDRIREQTRKRVEKYREKQKSIPCNVTVTHCNAIEEDIDKEEDIERDKIDYMGIVNEFNCICTSLPSVKAISDSRKKAIRARLRTYSVDDLYAAFRKAEASDFLKGRNQHNWNADFDWLMTDRNLARVLDGKYDNRTNAGYKMSAKAQELENAYSMMADWANGGEQ